MPAGPFMGAGLGQMMSGMTQGMAQGQLTRMLLDRQDRQDALREKELAFKNSHLASTEAKTELDQRIHLMKLTGQILAPVVNAPDDETAAQLWPIALQQAAIMVPGAQKLIDSGRIPREYNSQTKAWASSLYQAAIPIEKQFEMQNKQPTFHSVQEGDENVTYKLRPGGTMSEIGRGPKWSNREGLAVTLPDGTTISQGGKGKETPTGLQKPTMNKVEEDLLKATRSLASTLEIQKQFKPEYQTFGGQAKGSWLQLKDKLDAGSLNPDEASYLNDFTQYRAQAGQQLAESLKDMSGSAVTPQEMARQEVFNIKAGTGIFDGDSAQQVKAKIERFVQFHKRAIARLNYVRKNGLSIQNVPLEKMDRLIADRIGVLRGKLKAGGVPEEQLDNLALRTAAEEFGLVD